MKTASWVQNKIELFEGELIVFKRANSPNWYMRVYIKKKENIIKRVVEQKVNMLLWNLLKQNTENYKVG